MSDFLYDALSEQFHVQSETREEERIARLLCTLYTDCLEQKDFTGLQRMMDARRQVFKARADAMRKVREELAEDDEDGEEDWDGEDGDTEEYEDEEGGDAGLERRMDSLAVTEGKEEDSKQGEGNDVKEEKAEQAVEEEDGWTTVGGKQKSKKKGR